MGRSEIPHKKQGGSWPALCLGQATFLGCKKIPLRQKVGWGLRLQGLESPVPTLI